MAGPMIVLYLYQHRRRVAVREKAESKPTLDES